MSSKIELTLKTYSYFQSESFSSKEIVRNSNVRNSLQPCPLEDVSFLQRAELYWQVNTTSFEGSSDTDSVLTHSAAWGVPLKRFLLKLDDV